jgi:hypothetical protein
MTELNFDRAGLVLAEKFDATLRDFLGPFLGDLFRDGRWTRRGNDNFWFYRLKKLGGARVAGMMLALDQNVALQIVTCFEQRRLRVCARVGLKKHTNVFNDELHNQWRVIRRSNLKVRGRVKYVRVHVAAKEKRIATD